MKRGLKVFQLTMSGDLLISYNRYPDEKGTERLEPLSPTTHFLLLQPLPR